MRFLLLDPSRDHFNVREHVKREILEQVEFGSRGVRLLFNAPKPDYKRLGEILGEKLELKEEDPWHPDNRECLRGEVQEKLDRWLACYWLQVLWESPLAGLDADRRKKLKEARNACMKEFFLSPEDLFTKSGRTLVATLTALSVAGEILTEYSAIVECGLEQRIKLDGITWRESLDWERLPLLSSLLQD